MKTITTIALLILPLLLGASTQEEPAKPAVTIDALDFLAGSWQGEIWGGRFEAYYSTPASGVVMNHSRLLVEGKERFYEFELFEPKGDTLSLQPFPGGKKAGGFTLSGLDAKAKKAVFENPKKDHPTRIVYHRVSADRLVITLDDPHGGSDKKEIFDLGPKKP